MSTIKVTNVNPPTAGNAVNINGLAYPTAGPLSSRNLIVNGAMQVAQRSTSESVSDGSNEGYQTLDRFGFYFGGSADGAATISQSTTVPSGEGFSNSYKVDVTTTNTPSGTENIFIEYTIEAQDLANSGWNYTSASSYITFSFWARSSKAGTYCLYLDLSDTTTNEYYIAEYTLVANTWKRVEITVPGHADAVINNDNGQGLRVNWVLASNETGGTAGSWSDTGDRATTNQVNVFDSTDGEFYLTGVQLEVGQVATPFEHRSFGDELARCQRYFEKSVNYGTAAGGTTNPAPTLVGTNYGSNTIRVSVFYKVSKRATPTITPHPSSTGGSGTQWAYYTGSWTAASTAVSQSNENAFSIDVAGSGLSTNSSYIVDGNWYASSEL